MVNYPVKKYENLPELELDLEYNFNFLCISQMGPRKNIPNLIKWFIREFKDEEVGLVIKTNVMKNSLIDRMSTTNNIKQILASESKDRKCKIYLLHGDMTDEEIHSLYVHDKIKSFVSLTHGEGFGLPLFEAAYSGLPIVTVGWSGQCDFLFDTNRKARFYNVSFDIQPVQEEAVWDGVVQKDSMWSFAREDSAKNQMRKCYDDVSAGNVTACEYVTELNERFDERNLYDQFVDSILDAGTSQEAESKVIVL